MNITSKERYIRALEASRELGRQAKIATIKALFIFLIIATGVFFALVYANHKQTSVIYTQK